MDGMTVGEVARVAGVTVRTLHHWESVGLVVPSGRTAVGYRVYGPDDLGRLTRALTYRELGFSLDEVAQLLDQRDEDAVATLRRQHSLLVERIARLQQVAALVRSTLEARTMGIELTADEIAEVFGDEDPSRYADEVEQRWGETDAWRESRARTSAYSKDDWVGVRGEGEAIERRLAAAMADGHPAGSEVAVVLAEEHRLHICRSFYACDHAMHALLAQMYLDDPRFTAHFERGAPGLAAYVAAAITANSDRHA